MKTRTNSPPSASNVNRELSNFTCGSRARNTAYGTNTLLFSIDSSIDSSFDGSNGAGSISDG